MNSFLSSHLTLWIETLYMMYMMLSYFSYYLKYCVLDNLWWWNIRLGWPPFLCFLCLLDCCCRPVLFLRLVSRFSFHVKSNKWSGSALKFTNGGCMEMLVPDNMQFEFVHLVKPIDVSNLHKVIFKFAGLLSGINWFLNCCTAREQNPDPQVNVPIRNNAGPEQNLIHVQHENNVSIFESLL